MIKKEAQCSSERGHKKISSHESEIEWSWTECASLVVCTRNNFARINLTVFYQNISFSWMVISSIRFFEKVAERQSVWKDKSSL